MSTYNLPLSKPQRTLLENTVKAAREVAEKSARAALNQLAVAEARVPDYLSEPLKALRRRLRAHGRALGDKKANDDTQTVQQLVWEVSYEHWHRMLFARFLAENGLLLWEPGAAVSLDDCEALVQETDPTMNLGAKTQWELAGKLAARMLPQVFKPQSPVFELAFAPEHQRELERLLAALPTEVFKASDSLGWVYQFWQAKRKDEVNASEVKIGADELPAVTQLFTEPYMVDFLLHNSLGAWWMTRHPDQPCPVPMPYLRTLEDGTPAAGRFEGWPNHLQGFKLLDPSCGSGHFLVAAFLLLVPIRMAAEGLTAAQAVDAVLAENLHGLELDARCVEIAVFALALTAWRFPDENGDPLGVRADMPAPQVACCGLKVSAKPEDWMALVPDATENAPSLKEGLNRLHETFTQAPLLGSLLDPSKLQKGDLFAADFTQLGALLNKALAAEISAPATDERWDLALNARGLLEAAQLLEARYHLVITNVPYLARGKQNDTLKAYCETHYPDAKNDLANVFLERCLELAHASSTGAGVVQIVMPQNWLYQPRYEAQRRQQLQGVSFNLLAKLGPGAFEGISGEVVTVMLFVATRQLPRHTHRFAGLDVTSFNTVARKASELVQQEVVVLSQNDQLNSPSSVIRVDEREMSALLGDFASFTNGFQTGDYQRFGRSHWELPKLGVDWIPQQTTVDSTTLFGGCTQALLWQQGRGDLVRYVKEKLEGATGAWLRGQEAWGSDGIQVSAMGALPVSLYAGHCFDDNSVVLLPSKPKYLGPIWAFCSSDTYTSEVRKVSQALKVRGALLEVPFDLDEWTTVYEQRFPAGLPGKSSNDPTQWLFHGHPQPSTDPLQVAVARLVGYRWPAETDAEMELSDEARTWIARCKPLAEHTDDDGIVCLPSVRGEVPAHDRLLKLLIAAWETVEPGSWKPSVLDKLLADADYAGKGLEAWLRERFFEQHAKRFHHRPFIWHVWDGLKDGFAALVNYHRLDHKKLERLIHTYLGDWILQQEAGVREGVDGAQTRLAAAQDLKRRLELILKGDFDGKTGYDIFVRWKPLAEQPIGWNPDLNDGVRLNIRPFMTAEVLRHNKKPKLNITWDKDRGKDVESAPWFGVFKGERINDHHLTVAEKEAVQKKKSEG